MDPDLAAVVIRCVFDTGSRNQIAMSFNVDPVTFELPENYIVGRGVRGVLGSGSAIYRKTLLGCPFLEHNRAGRILIDADDALGALWNGINRKGELLTRKLGYASLIQLTLDHPVTQEILADQPVEVGSHDMRVWIQPKEIRLKESQSLFGRLFGGSSMDLEFEPTELQMFSETVRLSTTKAFRGSAVPNPGANLFTAFFNANFDKFRDFALYDDSAGRTIYPLQDAVELARTVAVVNWMKARRYELQIDAMALEGRVVQRTSTPAWIPAPDLVPVLADIRGPITVYNQYGPSRLIDADSSEVDVIYDADGRMTKMVRVTRVGNRITEVAGTSSPLVVGRP